MSQMSQIRSLYRALFDVPQISTFRSYVSFGSDKSIILILATFTFYVWNPARNDSHQIWIFLSYARVTLVTLVLSGQRRIGRTWFCRIEREPLHVWKRTCTGNPLKRIPSALSRHVLLSMPYTQHDSFQSARSRLRVPRQRFHSSTGYCSALRPRPSLKPHTPTGVQPGDSSFRKGTGEADANQASLRASSRRAQFVPTTSKRFVPQT